MTARRYSEAPTRHWRRTTARVATQRLAEPVVVTAPAVEMELWEADGRAFFVSTLDDGTVLEQLSAGRGYLREHDHVIRHQVLRDGFPQQQGLEVVRNAFGRTSGDGAGVVPRYESDSVRLERDSRGFATRLETPDVVVTWDYHLVEADVSGGPYIRRPRDYTWEVYALRQLPYLGSLLLGRRDLLADALPEAVFREGFLFASSWLGSSQAHLVWSMAEGEVELVVSDYDDAAAAPIGDRVVSLNGPDRMVDLIAPLPEIARAAAGALPLGAMASRRGRMPHVQDVVAGQWKLRPPRDA